MGRLMQNFLFQTLTGLVAILYLPLCHATSESACPSAPHKMRAARLMAHGGPDQLKIDSIVVPAPGAGEVLVRVSSASINPIDWKIRENASDTKALPWTPGVDAAGVITAVGTGVRGWRCGDPVVAYLDNMSQGSYSEFVVVSAADIARKPPALS